MTVYFFIGFVAMYLLQVVIIALQDYRAKQYREFIDDQNKYIRSITDSFALLQLDYYLEEALEDENYEKADKIKSLMHDLDARYNEKEEE